MKLAALFILFICSAASADCSAVLGGWSTHFEAKNEYGEEWNQDHSAVGLDCGGYSAMTMINSYGVRSYGAGYELDLRRGKRWHVGAYAGLWTGYKATVQSVPALTAGYKAGRFGVGVMVTPEAAVSFLKLTI